MIVQHDLAALATGNRPGNLRARIVSPTIDVPRPIDQQVTGRQVPAEQGAEIFWRHAVFDDRPAQSP